MEKEKIYGVWAVRSGASIFGRAEAWCKEDGKPLEFTSKEAAEDYAKKARQPYYGKRPLLCKRKGTGTRRCSERNGTAGFRCPRPGGSDT